MANRLSGRIAIVTGSSSGLGRGIALAFASEGASLVCADLQSHAHKDKANEFPVPTHELIIQQGGTSIFVTADVRDEGQIESLVAAAVKQFGRLDM